MLASVHIKGYPPFEDLEIPRLGGINLITGYNGAGKTALLRAIHLLAGSFTVETTGTVGLVAESEGRRVVLEGRRAAAPGASHAGAPEHRDTKAPEHRAARCAAGEGVSRGRPPPAPLPVACVFPDRDDERENARRLAQLGRGDRDALHAALRGFEPSLRSVESKGSALVCDTGLPNPMPLGLMGAGMVHAARLLLAVMTAKHGLVLVDGFENGLHHRQLGAVWRILCGRARRDRVQVFATTQSDECIRAALSAHAATLTAHPATLQQPLLVHRINDLAQARRSLRKGHICTTYPPDLLAYGLEYGTEWR